MYKRAFTAALAATALTGIGYTMASAQTKAPAGAAGQTVSYKVTADTYSGLGAGMMGARSAGSLLGAALSGRMTNPNAAAHMLTLELGSNRTPAGPPAAEHLPPQALGVGPTLPLVTPKPIERETPREGQLDTPYTKPRGKILIFWGCGEKARPGQPVVLDFAKMVPGQMTPQMMGMARMSAGQMARMADAMSGRGAQEWRTRGEWPNERTRNAVPGNGSLVGEHVVRGNYNPEIRFALAPNQDYLAPVQFTKSAKAASGAHQLEWKQIAHALGYSAMAFGGSGQDTMVMWSSAEMQNAPAPGDFASAAEVARLVAQKAMLAPTTTQCAIPAEAIKAMGESGFLTFNAVGPTSNFSFPARPAKAPANWAPDWTTKVQTRSHWTGMLGAGNMAAMMSGGDEGEEAPAEEQPKKRRKRSVLDGLPLPF